MGGTACRWIERNLVHGEGDFYGEAFHLTDDQQRFLWRWYEQHNDGRWRYLSGLLGRPKGYGKSELASAICCLEYLGPWAPTSPIIPVAASGFEQANLIFGTCGVMLSEGPLRGFVEVYETEILIKDRPGRMYRIAAVAGTNDGPRPTFAAFDEIHELLGNKARVHLVITNGLVKRKGRWLGTSTAGNDLTTLLGTLYQRGLAIANGDLVDDTFLLDWTAAGDHHDLTTREGLAAAVTEAYAGALGVTVDLDTIMNKLLVENVPIYEFERYYLNRWTAAAEAWLPLGAWGKLAAPREVARDEPIVLGFDGSYNQDATALVGCTLDGYIFVIEAWERPSRREDWIVPRNEVEAKVAWAMDHYDVLELACDPNGWHSEIDSWRDRWGSPPVIEFPPSRANMIPACSRFYAAVRREDITHDGDERLARHLANAVTKETLDGSFIVKDGKDSPRKIDLAIGAVTAYERAMVVAEGSGFDVYDFSDGAAA
jgi:phage terminase large subunit-like protein